MSATTAPRCSAWVEALKAGAGGPAFAVDTDRLGGCPDDGPAGEGEVALTGTAAHPPAPTKARTRDLASLLPGGPAKAPSRARFRARQHWNKTVAGGTASREAELSGRAVDQPAAAPLMAADRHREAPARSLVRRYLRPPAPSFRPRVVTMSRARARLRRASLPGLYLCAGPPAGGAISASGAVGVKGQWMSEAQPSSPTTVKRGQSVWRIKYVDATGKQVMETIGAERNGVTRKKPRPSSANAR